MIVVDSNVIAYCWIRGEHTPLAQRVRLADPDWHAPILWRSEMRSTLAGYMRHGVLDAKRAAAIMQAAESSMDGREHVVPSEAVLELVGGTALSAYDCEFVALAHALAVPLVTEDAAILKAFPHTAWDMETYLGSWATQPGVHQKRTRHDVLRRVASTR